MKYYSSYKEAEEIAIQLFYQQKHQEAIELLKDLMEEFPGNLYEIAWSLAIHYCSNGQYEKSLEMYQKALSLDHPQPEKIKEKIDEVKSLLKGQGSGKGKGK